MAVRFWPKVDPSGGPDACWPWLAGKDWDGYGVIGTGSTKDPGGYKHLRAHRVAWELTYGEPFTAEVGMHTCDNPGCVNPRHVVPGTNVGNTSDRHSKGRSACGERDGMAKITADAVIDIRRRRRAGEKLRSIGLSVGLTDSQVMRIARGDAWKHVPMEASE